MNFNESLEGEMKRLGVEIEKTRENPEAQTLPEREVIKQSLQALGPSAPVQQTAGTLPKDTDTGTSVLPAYLESPDADRNVRSEVEHLIGIVFRENIANALVASRKHPAFVQDAFHDALIDRLLPELKKRGIVK